MKQLESYYYELLYRNIPHKIWHKYYSMHEKIGTSSSILPLLCKDGEAHALLFKNAQLAQ